MDFTCTCGKKYLLPDDAAGKRARCKSCGEIFTVPSPEFDFDLAPSAREIAPTPGPMAAASIPVDTSRPMMRNEERSRMGRVQRSFWVDAISSFTIFSKLSNIGPLIGCAAVLFVAGVLEIIPIRSILKLVILCFFNGVAVAFFLDVVRTTAGGDDDLPGLHAWGDFWESIFKPLFEFIGVTLLLIAPAIVVVMWRISAGDSDESVAAWGYTVAGIGLLLWPICILAIATGGFSALVRMDLLILSIVRTIPAYLAIVSLMAGAVGLGVVMTGGLFSSSEEGGFFSDQTVSAYLAAQAILSAVTAYVMIVCMRAIGLYYRHFSERFPWTAG